MGHEHESGIINVYPDFGPVANTAFTGKVGTALNQAVSVGGVGPYSFQVAPSVALSGGQIYGVPPGLALSAGNAAVVLSGTPTHAGKYLFTLEAADSLKNSFAQQNYTVVIS